MEGRDRDKDLVKNGIPGLSGQLTFKKVFEKKDYQPSPIYLHTTVV